MKPCMTIGFERIWLCFFFFVQLEYAASVGDAKSKESREAEKKKILSLIDRF
mgnify:CR=1 FL=1